MMANYTSQESSRRFTSGKIWSISDSCSPMQSMIPRSAKTGGHLLGFGTTKGSTNRRNKESTKTITGGNLPDVLGVQQLANYLGVGKNTAYGLVHSRQIQAVQVGRQYRIRKEAVLEFLNGKK